MMKRRGDSKSSGRHTDKSRQSSGERSPARKTDGRQGPSKRPGTFKEAPKIQRLNKAIADAGVASRRAADELILNGKVKINGKVCTELGTKIGISDIVTVNGEPITRMKHLTYLLLNKPKDVITTSSDELGRTTVFDIVRLRTRLFTVGRLDRNTTGVLLLTNDGELANRLMHPRYGVPRIYKAKLDRPLLPEHARKIAAGVVLEDGPTQPCQVFIDPADSESAHIELYEGKNREVRRLFEHFGYDVKRLDRKQYAFLTARGLARGEYRHLTRDEVNELYKMTKLRT
jgi:23S rRNA pseudouridine2605 synthase